MGPLQQWIHWFIKHAIYNGDAESSLMLGAKIVRDNKEVYAFSSHCMLRFVIFPPKIDLPLHQRASIAETGQAWLDSAAVFYSAARSWWRQWQLNHVLERISKQCSQTKWAPSGTCNFFPWSAYSRAFSVSTVSVQNVQFLWTGSIFHRLQTRLSPHGLLRHRSQRIFGSPSLTVGVSGTLEKWLK